ncbi:5'-nucleotidase, lipoprotein e(P4) family [Oleisolibacter albus]|uniref:5'-nucleotidase, lipoprotein e(P4) family n=1 Tax=Oleisolibacter albus TaxID=2171757 RepID=UPI000DF23FAD|nr:HAD family acid phosphatase [Oleisolibacter albus]
MSLFRSVLVGGAASAAAVLALLPSSGSADTVRTAPPVAAAPVAEQAAPANDPRLNATLFMQVSEEMQRLSRQSFALAALRLPAALDEPGSAALEQADGGAGKPPAVIFDVDETVLDNSPAQARAILAGERAFNLDSWDKWVGERAAKAMPGAVDFVAELRRRKVRVVFITNRECRPRAAQPGEACPQQADTLANLRSAGLGPVDPADLMLKGQKKDWPSEKASRRETVASTHRIVMSVGDQFSDFMPVTRSQGPEERQRLAAAHEDLWRTRWIVIPNPSYGAWLDALPEPATRALRP